MLGELPSRGGQLLETIANTAYALRGKGGDSSEPFAIGCTQVGLASW